MVEQGWNKVAMLTAQPRLEPESGGTSSKSQRLSTGSNIRRHWRMRHQSIQIFEHLDVECSV
jgi:hypothetical protein